jgi:hypothetical protein
MADFRFPPRNDIFPVGTSVGAYEADLILRASGPPPGTAVSTQVATATGFTFTGLTQGLGYWAVGQVGSEYHWEFFLVPLPEQRTLEQLQSDIQTEVDTSVHEGDLYLNIEDYVPITANDDAAIQAAIAAAQASSTGLTTIVAADRQYEIANLHRFNGIPLLGQGPSTVFHATAPAAGIAFGPAIGTVPIHLSSTAGNFTFDGGGVATQGVTTNVINGDFLPIVVGNLAANADAFCIYGQNNNFSRLTAAAWGTGFCFALDNGAGGNNIYGYNVQGGNGFDIRQSVDSTLYGYAIPQDNLMDRGVFDNPLAATYGIRQKAGAFNVFRDSNIFNTGAARIVAFESNAGGYTGAGYINGQLHFEGRTEIIGSGGTTQAAFGCDLVSGGAAGGLTSDIALVVTGRLITSGVGYDVRWGCSTPVEFSNVDILRYGSRVGQWTAEGTGAWAYPVGESSVGGLTAINKFPTGPSQFEVDGGIEADQIIASAPGHSLLLAISGGTPVMYADGDTDWYRLSAGVWATSGKIDIQDATAVSHAATLKQARGDYICIQDQKAANTDGGTATTGSWATRDLNTEVVDTGNHATVASNQISLLAGTYRFKATVPGFATNEFKSRLRNITDSSTLLVGSNSYGAAASFASALSVIEGRFTISGTKTLEIQYRCGATQATNGLGVKANYGEVEVYTSVELWREP